MAFRHANTLYTKPFQVRAPDFRQVEYEFTYTTPAGAPTAFDALCDKKYTLMENGDYILPIGRRIGARKELVSGDKLTFTAQIKASLLPTTPEVQALELEVAGTEGSLTGKVILAA